MPRLRFRKNPLNRDILEKGEEKGKEEKSRQIALKMLFAGFSVPRLSALGLTREQIAQALDLDIERV
ncbi:hypothetical protein H0901_24150, partial [Microcystis aeruginosa BLCCF158]|nr:hypothetical protein [Microcystis aeruginosa BLCC-F158]